MALLKKNISSEYEISVFVPMHNEEHSFPVLHDKIKKAFDSLSVKKGQIIYVNDGSTDGTGIKLNGLDNEFRVDIVTHKKKSGLTEAMRSGFSRVVGKYVIFIPGDLESDPEEDIPKLYHALQKGYDIVAGERIGRKDGKVLMSRVFNLISRWLFNLDLHDMNWIKGFRREVLADIELRSDWHRFILMIAADKGYSITEVPVNWYKRAGGRSKFGFWRIPKSFFDVLAVKFLLLFRRKPMMFYGTVAFSFISSGVGIGIALAALWLARGIQIRPFLQLAFFLLLTGMFILMVGFLAEQVASLQERIDRLSEKISLAQKNTE